jgi:pilus assembly protein Flp/PilA
VATHADHGGCRQDTIRGSGDTTYNKGKDMLEIYVSLKNWAVRARDDMEGATAVEYGLMVALIAVVIIAAVTLVGTNLRTVFERIAAALGVL